MSQRDKWDNIYRDKTEAPQPCELLAQHQHLLPASGNCLDLAAGRGGNALYLANRGLNVAAWDISPVGLDQLSQYAAGDGVTVDTREIEITRDSFPNSYFDVIVVSHYLDREICPAINSALAPHGLLFYQTFSQVNVSGNGPGNPAYRLARNELLTMFGGLNILFYRDEQDVGDTTQGQRDLAYLIGQRR